jgi:hypothetical protein
MNKDIYVLNGYENRADYLDFLADINGISLSKVENMAELLGIEEDFDGLVSALQDLGDY